MEYSPAGRAPTTHTPRARCHHNKSSWQVFNTKVSMYSAHSVGRPAVSWIITFAEERARYYETCWRIHIKHACSFENVYARIPVGVFVVGVVVVVIIGCASPKSLSKIVVYLLWELCNKTSALSNFQSPRNSGEKRWWQRPHGCSNSCDSINVKTYIRTCN